MVVVQLTGGLGNQMFVYSFAMALQKNTDFEIKLDVNSYKNKKHRKLNIVEILPENKPIEFLSTKERFYFLITSALKTHLLFYRLNYYLLKFMSKFLGIKKPIKNKLLELSHDTFHPEFFRCKNWSYFIGNYFQNIKYFENIKDKISDTFKLNMSMNEENQKMKNLILSSKNSLMLHIRRGDYLTWDDAIILDYKYYQKALLEFLTKCPRSCEEEIEKIRIFVFSNDPKWVRDEFIPNLFLEVKNHFEFIVVDINDEDGGAFDLELMKTCQHQIIANSSFSFWAAYLNPNPNKIIIAPSKFFYSAGDSRLIPDDWIKINPINGEAIN